MPARRTKKWIKEWNATIGGSRAPDIMGVGYNTPAQVKAYMNGDMPLPNLDDSPDIKRGVTYEHLARREFYNATKKEVRPHKHTDFCYNDLYPWAHCLPDGWCTVRDEPIEIKCPRPGGFQKVLMNGLSPGYMVQAQHNMAVLDRPILHFVVFDCVNVQVIHVEVERDGEYIESLMESERLFFNWLRGDSSLDEIFLGVRDTELAEIPTTEGKLVKIDAAEVVKAATVYAEMKHVSVDAEALLDAATARLKDALPSEGSYEIVGDDGPILRIHWTPTKGKTTFDHKACVAEFPEAKKHYKTGKPGKQFRTYPLREEHDEYRLEAS